MSVCKDCADAADLVSDPDKDPEGTPLAERVKISRGHNRCAARNANLEPGQLPDCTCQHVVNAQLKESRTP